MKVIFLGTNGWFNTDTGNTVSVLIESEKYHIVFDAGDGIYKIDRFIKDLKPIYLFISHLHLDHITGLHTLNKFNFKQGIKICGQKGLKKLLVNVIRPPYSLDINKLSYKLEFIELPEGRFNLDFPIEALSLLHSVDTLGYRIELDNRTIAYLCDTGLCDNAIALAKDVDLVITECSFKSGQESSAWPHLSPKAAAELAKKANAKRLALVHFNPFLFPSLEDRKIIEKELNSIFPESFCATDGLHINC